MTGPGGWVACTAVRSAAHIHSRTSGCTISFSFVRSPGSPNTILPSRSRFSEPSGRSTPSPKTLAIWASPGEPGTTTSLAATSASMSTAP